MRERHWLSWPIDTLQQRSNGGRESLGCLVPAACVRLTASVVATAIGLGNISLPEALWLKIRDLPLERSEDNEACAHGRREEPALSRDRKAAGH